MEGRLKEQLEENGVDVKNTLKRFMGKEEMYQRFLGKFLKDESYENLKKSLEGKDYEEAFKYAHTLKGISANLGLEPVRQAVSEMVELLRGKANQEVEEWQMEEKWKEVEKKYLLFIGIIKEYC